MGSQEGRGPQADKTPATKSLYGLFFWMTTSFYGPDPPSLPPSQLLFVHMFITILSKVYSSLFLIRIAPFFHQRVLQTLACEFWTAFSDQIRHGIVPSRPSPPPLATAGAKVQILGAAASIPFSSILPGECGTSYYDTFETGTRFQSPNFLTVKDPRH